MSELETVVLRVDGAVHQVQVPVVESLLETLRVRLSVLVPKEGCAEGACGACTVRLDEEVVCSCLVPTVLAHDADVRTAADTAAATAAVREALVRADAVQCGFCSPGVVVSAAALLVRTPSPTRAQVVEAIAGNLCRCTGYVPIVDAVLDASGRLRGDDG